MYTMHTLIILKVYSMHTIMMNSYIHTSIYTMNCYIHQLKDYHPLKIAQTFQALILKTIKDNCILVYDCHYKQLGLPYQDGTSWMKTGYIYIITHYILVHIVLVYKIMIGQIIYKRTNTSLHWTCLYEARSLDEYW